MNEGYEILEYNYYCRCGEIDIIARDGNYLVFCEVKYRASDRNGLPEEAVSLAKQRMISKCAIHYMTVHRLSDIPCRFDVIGIQGKGGRSIHLYKNAFDYVR